MWRLSYTITALICLVSVISVLGNTTNGKEGAHFTTPQHLADHKAYTRKILLTGDTIDTTTHNNVEHDIIQLLRKRSVAYDENNNVVSEEISHFIVQLDNKDTENIQKVKQQIIQLLKQDNIHTVSEEKLLTYVPHHSYVFVSSYYTARAISKLPGVVWTGLLQPQHKISTPLRSLRPQHATRSSGNGQKQLNPQKSISLGDGVAIHVLMASTINSGSILEEWLLFINSIAQDYSTYCKIIIKNPSPPKFVINIRFTPDTLDITKNDIVAQIAEYLSSQPLCQWVEAHTPTTLANKYGREVLMSGSDPSHTSPPAPHAPLFDSLKGDGQVVGVADTGLDMNHAFFYDASGSPGNTVDNSKRKVIMYYAFGDTTDLENGHGTHVGGSVAGYTASETDSVNAYAGSAPNAKLAFVDIANEDFLLEPADLYSGLYQLTYDANARIHSDSWGSFAIATSPSAYALPSQEIDEFMYDHQDFLILRAAGNNGNAGFGTIFSQASSKNALVVGASQSTFESYMNLQPYSSAFSRANETLHLFCAANPRFCNYTFEQCCTEYQADPDFFYPLAGCCPEAVNATFSASTFNYPAYYNEQNVADFSSRGPTTDGRIKPDVVAPGSWIVSARAAPGASVPHEELIAQQGTSMATPLLAGATALLRQYFMDGRYPSGNPTTGDAFTPSAALMKSSLITSSQMLNGLYDSDGGGYAFYNANITGLFAGASYVQGFGQVRLGAILGSNQGGYFSIPSLQQNKTDSTVYNIGEEDYYCVRVKDLTPSATLKATLTWIDPPGSPASLITLVNDLNLAVSNRHGQVAYANAIFTSVYGDNGLYGPDFINTVEQVQLIREDFEEGQMYRFIVQGANVPIAPQSYSLSLYGEGATFERLERCPDCSVPGTSVACEIPHGFGQKTCGADMFYERCLVVGCEAQYTTSGESNSCVYLLDFNILIAIVCGSCVVLAILLGFYCQIRASLLRKSLVKGSEPSLSLSGVPTLRDIPEVEYDPLSDEYPIIQTQSHLMQELLMVVKPHMWTITFSTVCALLATTGSLFQPYYLSQVVNLLPGTTHINQLSLTFILIAVFMLTEFIFTILGNTILMICGEKMIAQLRQELFDAIMRQDMYFFDKNSANELSSRLTVDVPMLKSFLTQSVVSFFTALAKLVGSCVFLFIISWKLSLLFFGAAPLLVILVVVYGNWIQNFVAYYLDTYALLMNGGAETIAGVRLAILYAKRAEGAVKYKQLSDAVYFTARKMALMSTLYDGSRQILMEVLAILMFYFGAMLVIDKNFSVALLVGYFLYIGYVVDAIGSFTGIYEGFKQGMGSAHKIFSIICLPKSKTHGTHIGDIKGTIEFNHVTFSYPIRPDQVILDNITLRFDAGKSYGIVGSSGSGKSTIFQMIVRMYDTVEYDGAVKLDGRNIKDWNIDYLRSQIAVVDQDPILFNVSIKENISYAKANATDEEIERAARQANAHEFIEHLPEGYNTFVGDRGSLLSGGQRKRISIARAFLANARVLLLDELTGDLDAETEKLVGEAIERLRMGRTTIMIAHKLNTVEKVYKIFVIKDGRMVECGNHDRLVKKKGTYWNMLKLHKNEEKQKVALAQTRAAAIAQRQSDDSFIGSPSTPNNSNSNSNINNNNETNNNNNES